MNLVCVNIFDANNSSEVQTKFCEMCVTTGVDCCKSETLYNAINDKFVKDEIHWQNVIVLLLIIQVPSYEFAILLNHVDYRKILIVSLQVVIAT